MFRKLLSLFSPSKPSKPFVPPTQKQIEYAKLCGVDVRPGMDREALSKAIDDAFAADPRLKFKLAARQKKKAKQAEAELDQLPAPLKREFNKWDAASDEHERFVVVYQHGRDVVVDILECEAVRLDKGTVVVDFFAPRVQNVVIGHDGKRNVRADELNWDRKLSIRTSDIKESRKIDISEDQVAKYQSTIKRKVK